VRSRWKARSWRALHGCLYFHSETGTEGGWYAFFDDAHAHRGQVGDPCPWSNPDCPVMLGLHFQHRRYEGLHRLRNGDHLTVWEENGTIVFDGIVKLNLRHDIYHDDQATVLGWWVNQEPAVGVDRETWATWFFDELPATLRRSRP